VAEYNKSFTIKAWAEEDRPREKLLIKGKSVLSDAELIAILIGSGSKEETAVKLAQKILKSVNNDLQTLATLSITDLKKFKGIGEAKAVSIVAALELGNRKIAQTGNKKEVLSESAAAARLIQPLLSDLPHEEFWVLLLNRANHLISKQRISTGGVTGTVADIKIILKLALENLASSIILCHNHPSGNLKPSEADIRLTKKLKEAASLMDITIADHLIVSRLGYYSFADERLI